MSMSLNQWVDGLLKEMQYDKDRLTMAEELLRECYHHITSEKLKQEITEYLTENELSRQ